MTEHTEDTRAGIPAAGNGSGLKDMLCEALGKPEGTPIFPAIRSLRSSRDAALQRASTAERRAAAATELVLALHLDGRLRILTPAEEQLLRIALDVQPGDEGSRLDIDARLRELLAPRTFRVTPPPPRIGLPRTASSPALTCGDLAAILPAAARAWRAERKATVMDERAGELLTVETARAVGLGFAAWHGLDTPVQRHLLRMVTDWARHAVAWLGRNQHMHDANGASTLTPQAFDAILVGLVNYACAPLDLGFYARDLEAGL